MSKLQHFDEEHWAIVNEFLSAVPPDAAYRMGLTSTLCMLSGVKPTRELFDQVVKCSTNAEVAAIFKKFKLMSSARARTRNQAALPTSGKRQQKGKKKC